MNNFKLPFIPNIKYEKTNPALTVDLGETKVIKSIPARTITASNIAIMYIVDKYTEKKVIAHTEGPLGQITLWEGAEYDAIGQWTDQDVTNKILEIVNAINP